MAFSYDVRFYAIRVRKDRPKPYMVRWRVGQHPAHSKSFTHRELARSWLSQLNQAARRGEGFDEETGLPESIIREQQSVTFFDLACRFVDLKWPHAAAKTRTATADALATVTPLLVTAERGKPEPKDLRRALYGWAFHKARREAGPPDNSDAAVIEWVRRHSHKVATLDEKDRRSAIIRAALDGMALRMDGMPAAATTIARKRAVFYGVLSYAVELDILPANPIDKVRWKAPKVADEVDRRVVASPAQVRALLAAVEAERPELTAFFGCLYYASMRPGEAVALVKESCAELPEKGWGLLILSDSMPRVGSTWTDDGTSHDKRNLKRRAKKTTRPVPIPPELVRLLRRHVGEYGTADGRLFRGARDKHLSESVYGPVWRAAREKALSAGQVRSPLAARPYDLRHSGVTLALNAGVPAPEIARRAGHSVEVLLRVYAGCIDGQDALWNRRISEALDERNPAEPDSPGVA